jgi:hypothetical protein
LQTKGSASINVDVFGNSPIPAASISVNRPINSQVIIEEERIDKESKTKFNNKSDISTYNKQEDVLPDGWEEVSV